ncbi:MAG: hypothetical protein HZA04_00320 [Nitrospinae bacterium]|nr:hypothetical protein [Nitrospinota bacterium]
MSDKFELRHKDGGLVTGQKVGEGLWVVTFRKAKGGNNSYLLGRQGVFTLLTKYGAAIEDAKRIAELD